MAKPAFIYAFDNLSPDQFAHLCGLLLAQRFKGFFLGGVGHDGGVDGELDPFIGEWSPETDEPLLNEIIAARKTVIFQFKHIVTARAGGQSEARKKILSLYKSTKIKSSELRRHLVEEKQPHAYVLITNIEVNSEFRDKFVKQCKLELSNINHYQIIGLDELETWISSNPQIGSLYFPTIFGLPRFDLKIKLSEGFIAPTRGGIFDIDFNQVIELFEISVLNIGTMPSYIGGWGFRVIAEESSQYFQIIADPSDPLVKLLNNPPFGQPLEPGRKVKYCFPFVRLPKLKINNTVGLPVEVYVFDDIENLYFATIPADLRQKIMAQLNL